MNWARIGGSITIRSNGPKVTDHRAEAEKQIEQKGTAKVDYFPDFWNEDSETADSVDLSRSKRPKTKLKTSILQL